MSYLGTQAEDLSSPPLSYTKICVIGAGSWGTALASVARRAGRQTAIWGRDEATVEAINTSNENPKYLPGIPLPEGIEATTDMAQALDGAEAVLLVTPSRTLRDICRQMRPHLGDRVPVTLCAKGIEAGTGYLLSEVASEILTGHQIGALSGPTFATETALGHLTAATIAFQFSYADRLDTAASPAARLALSLGSDFFRPYISDDLVGVEVSGAVKNVIAIACGMMTGAGYAENTRAALIVRGMDEMKTLADVFGGRRETVTGLAGAGDLTLTCSSQTSRNMSLGVQLGKGIARDRCFDGKPVVVEGEVNSVSVMDLARRMNIRMPICESVYQILHQGADVRQTFADLWSRPIEGERRGLAISINHPATVAVEAAQ
ncbi:MAG: NAD(P)-dependent glycerol-3-phosphate dehydrogenase [Hoeflea sp.]|uniref:NAD(P)H-dependent glycerol-3-phosphate dehydrogenase n=1 Tax=Hoeflea sp. TaxID=1940281 RepID=UPI001DA77309|nr:NAD(P)H-dependent glycerol-3-phosphate dehydrogenase [Hoeflea sp.]MBU4527269.1 NAD(P)-dependent glycerol-3-phosphate dehydrogenase [Alphaproteobacteria bacterium]MBU4546948.1 NAD(P)-dependent glycerol-3-phosphate dehydrogenase [Alphaproteobacteria bacterium]MBU4551540.1 NAD(P)-dependent glycerol-3-phosphate dehydrogenase [Alphaproteobacteria bacterium]MBV1725545.1 NAD(P)-dependent glycerol-3-phosphate dehydrogenase [Hoeflea sp.]MBV1759593.1 NAD(P)-dependent glycerol-3-phosphate dehydrogenas